MNIRKLLNLQPGERATFQVEMLKEDYEGPQMAIACLDPAEKCCIQQFFKITAVEVEKIDPLAHLNKHFGSCLSVQ